MATLKIIRDLRSRQDADESRPIPSDIASKVSPNPGDAPPARTPTSWSSALTKFTNRLHAAEQGAGQGDSGLQSIAPTHAKTPHQD